jgi:RNA polymerase sigma-70 factor (ECF subfamily)
MAQVHEVTTSPTLLRELASPSDRERAWRAFLERYLPLISDRCRQMGLQHADAEEVSGAVLSRLVETMQTFVYDPQYRFRGWLRKVVANAVHSFRRRAARHPGDCATGSPGAHRLLMGLAARENLDDLVATLEARLEEDLTSAHRAVEQVRGRVLPHTWQAYWLTAIEGCPAAEAAAKLGMTVAAVYVATNRVGTMLLAEGAKCRASASRPNEATP